MIWSDDEGIGMNTGSTAPMDGLPQKPVKRVFNPKPPKPRCDICGSTRLKLGKDGLCHVCRDERNRIDVYMKKKTQ